MSIVHKLLPDGAFVVGNTLTRITSYAYPTSTHAAMGRKSPRSTAIHMLRSETRMGNPLPWELEYDASNWLRLDDAP